MISKFVVCLALTLCVVPILPAAVIGTNSPSQPVTLERIATLPAAQRAAWEKYLEHSARQWQADQDFLRQAMKAHGLKKCTNAPYAATFSGIPLNKSDAWYGGDEGRRIVAEDVRHFLEPPGYIFIHGDGHGDSIWIWLNALSAFVTVPSSGAAV